MSLQKLRSNLFFFFYPASLFSLFCFPFYFFLFFKFSSLSSSLLAFRSIFPFPFPSLHTFNSSLHHKLAKENISLCPATKINTPYWVMLNLLDTLSVNYLWGFFVLISLLFFVFLPLVCFLVLFWVLLGFFIYRKGTVLYLHHYQFYYLSHVFHVIFWSIVKKKKGLTLEEV